MNARLDPSEFSELSDADSDQLPIEDTLLDRQVTDLLDEGYSPLDHPVNLEARELEPETLDERLNVENPEVWSTGYRPGVDETRTGRLVAHDDSVKQQDVFATDAGVDGAGSSAEEAAMHVVDEDYDDDEFEADDDGATEESARPYAD